jgi:hypothetical protein
VEIVLTLTTEKSLAFNFEITGIVVSPVRYKNPEFWFLTTYFHLITPDINFCFTKLPSSVEISSKSQEESKNGVKNILALLSISMPF